jgi:general secretion pathway protein G
MMYEHTNDEHRRRHAKAGFTLFEMVIVAGIIGALLAFIIPQIVQYQKSSKVKTARIMIQGLQQAIMTFEADIGRYPNTLKELVVRPQDPEVSSKWLKDGYMLGKKQLPKDPWQQPYIYKLTPDGQHAYELYSYGPDGKKAPKVEWINVHNL